MYNIHADKLSDAIRKSDVEQVKLLLQNTNMDKCFVKYLDTAEKVINMRQGELVLHNVKPHIDVSAPDPYGPYMLVSLLGCFGFMESAYYFDCKSTNPKFMNCISRKDMVDYSMSGMLLSGVAFIISLSGSFQSTLKHLEKMHDRAITIKEMLYDHMNAAENS